MAKILGIAKIHVGSTLLRSKEGASITLGGFERTEVAGYEVYGYVEKAVGATVSCTLAHTADLSLADLAQTTDAVIRFECDNGTTYIVEHAYMRTTPQVTAGSGDVACEFGGMPAREELP